MSDFLLSAGTPPAQCGSAVSRGSEAWRLCMSLRRKDGNGDKLQINKSSPFATATPSNHGIRGERIVLKSIIKSKVSSANAAGTTKYPHRKKTDFEHHAQTFSGVDCGAEH